MPSIVDVNDDVKGDLMGLELDVGFCGRLVDGLG